MDEVEICGNCGNCKYIDGEWICTCEASDAHGCPTMYEDSCEEWCRR